MTRAELLAFVPAALCWAAFAAQVWHGGWVIGRIARLLEAAAEDEP